MPLDTSCSQASKRQGASGRLHRTVTGEWVWSEEEEEVAAEETAADSNESDEEPSVNDDQRPMNELQKAESSGSENEEVRLYCIVFSW